VTWADALRHADQQIAEWQRTGVGPAEALMALHNEQPARWRLVRDQMAAWAMLHRERWED
jgi:hypothetical protein